MAALVAFALTVAHAQEQPVRYDLQDRIEWMATRMGAGATPLVPVVCEGPELTPVELVAGERAEATAWQPGESAWREPGGALVVRDTRERLDEPQVATRHAFSFTNEGEQTRLLDVVFPWQVGLYKARWWDGRTERVPAEPTFEVMGTQFRLPMSAALGHDPVVSWFPTPRPGVALALDPNCLLSLWATGASGEQFVDALSLRTRIVVDPGQTVEVPLVVFTFPYENGFRGAAQRYYELFPERFSVAEGTRPSLIGGGGYLFSRKLTRELQWEEARRFGMGWEWAYCPAQTPGDWYADERFYDPEKGYMGDVDRHRNEVKGSLEDYRRDLRERFYRGWWATNIAYYMLPHAADLSVLEMFSDGVMIGKNGQPGGISVGWIKPDVQTRMTHPWGNSHGEEVKREITQIAQDYQVSAIGFDEANMDGPHYGAGIDGDPARAWDDDGGVYCAMQVALARLGEHIHQQDVRGYTMAMIMNKPTAYPTATRADVGMYEWKVWERTDGVEELRLLMGHKPLSWWGPPLPEKVLDWERMSPEEIRAGIAGIYDYLRLMSLRWGAFPMNMQVWGVERMVKLMPELHEMLTEGWEAAPGFSADKRLWTARYGTGVHSFLVLANPTRETVPAQVRPRMPDTLVGELSPDWDDTLFCAYDGAERSVERDEHARPIIPLGDLGPHDDAILRAAVHIDGAKALTGSASMSLDALSEGALDVTWKAGEAFEGTVTARIPRGATPLTMTVAGEEQQFEALDGEVRWKGVLPREGSLRVTWRQEVVVEATRQQIAGFPFVDGDALATVVLPADPTDRDRYVAEHLSIYFDYWHRRQEKPWGQVSALSDVEPGPRLPVAEAAEDVDGARILLADAERPTVRIDGQALVIAGPDDRGREKAMLRLLELLDEQRPYYGAFPEHPMYEKAGMVGRTLEGATRAAMRN